MKKNAPYFIIWIDIQTENDEWIDEAKLEKIFLEPTKPFRNLGYYLGENEDYYFFCSGFSNEGEAFDITQFPKGCIKQFIPIDDEALSPTSASTPNL